MTPTLLLDTHALLWWLAEPEKLSSLAHAAINDPAATVFVSAATGWELATKGRLGKLPGAVGLAAASRCARRWADKPQESGDADAGEIDKAGHNSKMKTLRLHRLSEASLALFMHQPWRGGPIATASTTATLAANCRLL